MNLDDALQWNSIGTGLRIGGQVFTGIQQLQAGEQYTQAAAFQAAQLRQNAGQALAASQRDAYAEQRKTQYLISRAVANAAAGGGGVSDPTVITLIAGIEAEGAYRQATALYGGQERARAVEMQAQASEYDGEARSASMTGRAISQGFGAAASLVAGMAENASLYQRFGGRGPKVGG